ncbi:MAG: AMP-binding protein [Pseudomonadota bacterium]
MPQEIRFLADLFDRTVRRQPDAPALEIGRDVWTYAELHAISREIAGQLRTASAELPARVALSARRSMPLFGAYIALQDLGCSVVPLDPGYPVDRAADVLDRCTVTTILVDDAGAEAIARIPEARDLNVVRLPDMVPDQTITQETTPPMDKDVLDEVYVLFTSGSTGRPKGVPIRQYNVLPLVRYMIDRYEIGQDSRYAQTFGQTFDPFIANMFAVWGGGGTLIDLTPDEVRDPVRSILEHRLTHWFSVSSAVSLAHAAGNIEPGKAPALQHSIFGAEPFTLKQAELWNRLAPNSKILNVYGPTETVLTCADMVLGPDRSGWPVTENGTVPIGKVYDHLEHLIIDADGNPSDDGELCIRGPQRFDGYLEATDNRHRFVRRTSEGTVEVAAGHELTRDDWYRTGDSVRWEGGALIHCGRIDKQIKVLGHRVEPGEIEAQLRRHPEVVDVVVVKSKSDPDKLHAAYSGAELDSAELVAWLKPTLPVYMIPGTFAFYDEMPTSFVGKIDRNYIEARS